MATTTVSFLPVCMMTGSEGKLFRPLAFTKTFALVASVIVALTIIPPAAHMLLAGRRRSALTKQLLCGGLAAEKIGVALLDSLLMTPQKTQSRMIPFGRKLRLVNDPNEAPCRTCRVGRCPMRIEEYAGMLGG